MARPTRKRLLMSWKKRQLEIAADSVHELLLEAKQRVDRVPTDSLAACVEKTLTIVLDHLDSVIEAAGSQRQSYWAGGRCQNGMAACRVL